VCDQFLQDIRHSSHHCVATPNHNVSILTNALLRLDLMQIGVVDEASLNYPTTTNGIHQVPFQV
jgi:hypothetical protein